MSLIPHNVPSRVILVDACLSGIGVTDGQYAYAQQATGIDSQPLNITELEAINVVVALHTFIGRKDCGSHIRIRCDNQAAVSVFSTGKAHNKVLQECARAAWMVQATFGVDLSYDHIPGKDNDVADALSRAHLSGHMGSLATSLVNHYSLVCIDPCLFFISNPVVSVNSRPSHQASDGPGRVEAGVGKGSGHKGKSQEYRGDIHRVHGVGWDGPPASVLSDHLRIHGVYGRICPSTGNYPKQVVSSKDVPAHGRYGHWPGGPHEGQDGDGRLLSDKSYVQRKKDALPMDEMAKGLAAIPQTPIGNATLAGVLIMFYGALRQSEGAPLPRVHSTPHATPHGRT